MSERSENEQCEKCGRGFNRIGRLVDWMVGDEDIYLCIAHSKQLEKIMLDWIKAQ